MSDWTDDTREIRSVKLDGRRYHWGTGDRFERFERPGEYCHLPWIRITTWTPHQTILEAALTHVEFIEIAPARETECN